MCIYTSFISSVVKISDTSFQFMELLKMQSTGIVKEQMMHQPLIHRHPKKISILTV